MEKSEIDGLINDLCHGAQSMLEKDDRLEPIGFVIKNNQVIPCMMPFVDDKEKMAIHLAIGAALKKLKSTRIILISDAAMRAIDPDKYEDFKKNFATEQPLMYPESQRQDGIFIQDINVEKGFSKGYFMRYENLKDAPRLFHNLMRINKEEKSLEGDIFDWVMKGYKDSDKFVQKIEEADKGTFDTFPLDLDSDSDSDGSNLGCPPFSGFTGPGFSGPGLGG